MLTLSWDSPCTYRLPKAVVTACTASEIDTVPTVGLNSAVFGIVIVSVTVLASPICVLPLYVIQRIVKLPDVADGKLLAMLFGTVQECEVPTLVAMATHDPDPIL